MKKRIQNSEKAGKRVWKKRLFSMGTAVIMALTPAAAMVPGMSVLAAEEAPVTQAVPAQEIAPALTAESVLAAVNANLNQATAVDMIMTENISVAYKEEGIPSAAGNVNIHMQYSPDQIRQVADLKISMGGLGMWTSLETLETRKDGVVTVASRLLPDGEWQTQTAPASAVERSTAETVFITPDMISQPVLSVNGDNYRIQAVVSADLVNSMYAGTGLPVEIQNQQIPIILDIDAATLLPEQILLQLDNVTVSSNGMDAVTSVSCAIVYNNITL